MSAQQSAPNAELAILAERSLASAERAGSVAARIAALGQVGWVAEARADGRRVLEVAHAMLRLADEDPAGEAARTRGLDNLGGAMLQLGRVDEAQEAYRQAVQLSPAGSRVQAIRLVSLVGSLLAGPDQGAAHVSEIDQALTLAQASLEEVGDDLGLAMVGTARGRLLVVVGELDAAEEALSQAADTFCRRPERTGQAANAIGRASLQLARGQVEPARGTLRTQLQQCIAGDFPAGRQMLLHHWAMVDPEGCPTGCENSAE